MKNTLYTLPKIFMALTKHPEGSIRELWTIAFPLMISSFSVLSMLFVDRILLANYSTMALNAAVNASTMGWVFIYAGMVLASIAEVFVAQFNGAGHKNRLGEPVWQMLWVSLGSFAFFIPMSLWGGELFYGASPHENMERDYFKWMVLFGPSYAMYSALCGFFVGQGKIHMITWLAVVANLVNAGLDVILIFGIEGVIPSYGIEGAAIATSCSSIFQVIVLGYVFLKAKNRIEFGTSRYHLQPALCLKCLKVGLPGSVFVGVEIFGFAAFYWLMTLMGERYITVAGINQSIVLLFYFFAEGVSKAVTTIVGNYIGAKSLDQVPKVLLAGLKLHFGFFVLILMIFLLASDILVTQFLPNEDPDFIASLNETLFICLIAMAFYLFFEGMRLLLSGILTAAGETLFLLFAGCVSVWAFLVFPVYFIVVKGQASVEVAVFICLFYSVAACFLYYWRYRDGRWKTNTLISAI